MDVVLMNAEGQAIGTAPKEALHGEDTPLHLAFSCHLVGEDGRLLLTRRALGKRSWPGVWTNSFCGHPQPGEEMHDAIRRHARSELGIDIDDLRVVLPLAPTVLGNGGTVVQAAPSSITVNDTDNVNISTAIAAKVTPSVVTISALARSGGGTGSGVILSEDGYVLTNTHVVTLDGSSDSASLRVTASDGRVYDANIVGTAPMYDLAVIKLTDASGLTPVE